MALLLGCGNDAAAGDPGVPVYELPDGGMGVGSEGLPGSGDGDGEGDGDGDGDGDSSGNGDGDCTVPATVRDGDRDGDGLPDTWEQRAADNTQLDPDNADTDGDCIGDGSEDPDADGLSNLQELALGRLTAVGAPGLGGGQPDPLRPSLAVELDAMDGLDVSDAVLIDAAAVFDDLPVGLGIDLHFYRDERKLSSLTFDGSSAQLRSVLRDHGPAFTDRAQPPVPYDQLLHLILTRQRSDIPGRGGQVVTDPGGELEATGVLIFLDALAATPGQCTPPITLEQAVASAIAHELGHALQLGHDSEVGNGINYHNLMSVPATCLDAYARFHGQGNDDPDLGATEAIGASRFSRAAADLLDLASRLSVDTALLVNGGLGREM